MVLKHMVQDHMVLDHKSRPKSPKSDLYLLSSTNQKASWAQRQSPESSVNLPLTLDCLLVNLLTIARKASTVTIWKIIRLSIGLKVGWFSFMLIWPLRLTIRNTAKIIKIDVAERTISLGSFPGKVTPSPLQRRTMNFPKIMLTLVNIQGNYIILHSKLNKMLVHLVCRSPYSESNWA